MSVLYIVNPGKEHNSLDANPEALSHYYKLLIVTYFKFLYILNKTTNCDSTFYVAII